MVERAPRELAEASPTTATATADNDVENPLRGVATSPTASSSAVVAATTVTEKSARQEKATRPPERAASGCTRGAGAATSLNYCPRGEPDRLEVLQLTAKGQELGRAMVVVEGVLNKMEEQVREDSATFRRETQEVLVANIC